MQRYAHQTPLLITPPEATNTGPGFDRGSGGGARGCGFEERAGAYAYIGGSFPIANDLCLSGTGYARGADDRDQSPGWVSLDTRGAL